VRRSLIRTGGARTCHTNSAGPEIAPSLVSAHPPPDPMSITLRHTLERSLLAAALTGAVVRGPVVVVVD